MPDRATGTVYVNSVAGPKFYVYTPTYQPLMAKVGREGPVVPGHQRLTAARLTYRAHTAAGTLFDTFTLTK